MIVPTIPDTHEPLFRFMDYDLYQLEDPLAMRDIYLSYVRLRDSVLKKQLISYLEDRAEDR